MRVVQCLSLVLGATLLGVYAAAQVDAVRGRAQALEAFERARNELSGSAAAETGDHPAGAGLEYSGHPDQSLWDATRLVAYRDSPAAHRDAPIGVLAIPGVGLNAPIFNGTGELALTRGIGRIEGTASLDGAGNVGLAAHRDGFFRVLKDVQVDDEIMVQSLHGSTRYRVTELLIVDPTDVYVLEPTESATLTLVTCYPFYFIGAAPQRYIVKSVAAK